MSSFYDNYDPHAYQVMFRPKMSTKATPREWWKYAIRSVLFDLRKAKKHDGWQIALARNAEVLNNVRGIMNQIPSIESLTYEQIKQLVDLSLEKTEELEKSKAKTVKKLTPAQLEVKLMEKEKEIAEREKALSEKDTILAEKEKEKDEIRQANNNLSSENDVLMTENETLKKMMQMLLNPKHFGDEGLSANDIIQYQLLAMEKTHNEELAAAAVIAADKSSSSSSNNEEESKLAAQKEKHGETLLSSGGHDSGSNHCRPHSRCSEAAYRGSPSLSPEKVTSAPSPYDVTSLPPKTLHSKYKDKNGDVDSIDAHMPKVVHLNYLQKEEKRKQELKEKKKAIIVRTAEQMVASSRKQQHETTIIDSEDGTNSSTSGGQEQQQQQQHHRVSEGIHNNTKPKKVPSLIKKLPSPRACLLDPTHSTTAGSPGSVEQVGGPVNSTSKSPRGRSISPRGRCSSPRGGNINNANGRRGAGAVGGGRSSGGDFKVVQHQPVYLNKLPPEVRPNEQTVVDALSKFKTKDGMKKKLTKIEMNLFVSPFAKPLINEKSSPSPNSNHNPLNKQQQQQVNILQSAQLAAAEKIKQRQHEQQQQGTLSAGGENSTSLPAGWVQLIDVSSGLPYYLNEPSGESQWEPPQAAVNPPVAVEEQEEEEEHNVVDSNAVLIPESKTNDNSSNNNDNIKSDPIRCTRSPILTAAETPVPDKKIAAAETDGATLDDSLHSNKSENRGNSRQSPTSQHLSPIVRSHPSNKGNSSSKNSKSKVNVSYRRKPMKSNNSVQLPALFGQGRAEAGGAAGSPPTLPQYKSAATEIQDVRLQQQQESQETDQQQIVLISPRIAKSVPNNNNNNSNRVKVKPLAHSKSVEKAPSTSVSSSHDQQQASKQNKKQLQPPSSFRADKMMELTLSDGTVVVVAVDEKGNPKQVVLAPLHK